MGRAMTRIAMLDIRNRNYKSAIKHADTALDYGRNDSTAKAVKVLALKALGLDAEEIIAEETAADPLNHYMRYLADDSDFYALMDSNPLETVLDIVFDFDTMGLYGENVRLLSGLIENRPEAFAPRTTLLSERPYCGLYG